jgi:hypothetical protein
MLKFLKKLFGLDQGEKLESVVPATPVNPVVVKEPETSKQIEDDIMASRKQQISDLYKEVLGREADQGGLDYWVSTPHDIDTIREEFMKSDEFNTKMRVEAITALYKELLKRDPDEAGLKYWVETPDTLENIRGHIISSEEYKELNKPKEEVKKVAKAAPVKKAPAKAPAKPASKAPAKKAPAKKK